MSTASSETFEALAARLAACRLCSAAPLHGPALPHAPRPILQGSLTARVLIASQAPGARAHGSGIPFQDPSGIRLRNWLGLDEVTFYDAATIAILPMGHCFPGHDRAGGDLPPRRECAETWRRPLLNAMPAIELVLCIGLYAQAWHLGRRPGALTGTVRDFRAILAEDRRPRILPLPHPSWRNSGWLKRHPWFEGELLPVLRTEVAALVVPRS